jgi:heterodisulfide reductase subunit A-like polyferredoxin
VNDNRISALNAESAAIAERHRMRIPLAMGRHLRRSWEAEMTEKRTPVLILGGGVGGLATSVLLAHHGVHSLLLEKRRETFVYPKARNLTFRSLEILRGLGLG